MSSRADRKRRQRDAVYKVDRTVSLKAGEVPGTYELNLALQHLPVPQLEFYANTATLYLRPNVVTFVFGQLGIGVNRLNNAITIDVPRVMIPPLVRSFDETFRTFLKESTERLEPQQSFTVNATQPHTVSYMAQIAKLVVNNFAGLADFYELRPTVGKPPTIEPVIRVTLLPAVLRFVVDSLDRLAPTMPDLLDPPKSL